MTTPADQYLHAAKLDVELGEATFEATVHLGLVNGRTVCVGLDLHGFELLAIDEEDGVMKIKDPDEWHALTARRLRLLRLDELVETARRDMIEYLEQQLEAGGQYWTADVAEWFNRTRALYTKPERGTKTGRPAHLSDQMVAEVVAGAYDRHVKAGGKTPVLAVQEALQSALEAGQLDDTKFIGIGPSREVTIHQARALVRRARKLGLLPEAPRSGGKREEDEE